MEKKKKTPGDLAARGRDKKAQLPAQKQYGGTTSSDATRKRHKKETIAISHHIKGSYTDREFAPVATIRKYRIVQSEGGIKFKNGEQCASRHDSNDVKIVMADDRQRIAMRP